MEKLEFRKAISITIFISAILGLLASFILTIETLSIYKNANQSLTCDLNSIISCSSVMKTPQAEIFGFPNSLLGIVAYTGIIAISMVLFFHRLDKRLLYFFYIGVLGSFIFSYWLIYQSIFNIGFLCPYCLLSCFAATNIFFATSLYFLKENFFNLNSKINQKIQLFISKQYYFYLFGLWYFILIATIFLKYKDAFI